MRVWTDAGMTWEVSVNIAAPHFHRSNFVQRLKYILHTCPEVSPRGWNWKSWSPLRWKTCSTCAA